MVQGGGAGLSGVSRCAGGAASLAGVPSSRAVLTVSAVGLGGRRLGCGEGRPLRSQGGVCVCEVLRRER